MMKIYFHTNYPKDLITAVNLIHNLQVSTEYEVERTSKVEGINYEHSVIFLFDHAKKNIDLVTEAHCDSGYRVFAFKLPSTTKLDPFRLAITLVGLWPKILDTINKESSPFVFSYSYTGRGLKREK